MRKLKSKKEKVKKKKNKPGIFKDTSLQDELYAKTHSAELLVVIATEYLREHRELWNEKGCVLQPYLKALLTKTVNRLDKWVREYHAELPQVHRELIKEDYEQQMSVGNFMKNYLVEITNHCFSEDVQNTINNRLLHTFLMMSFIIDTVNKKALKTNVFAGAMRNDFINALDPMKNYLKFWFKEIDESEFVF